MILKQFLVMIKVIMTAVENFDKRFDLSDVKPEEGAKLSYLDYNFKGFPAIASYAKLTAMQNDVKTTEANLVQLILRELI